VFVAAFAAIICVSGFIAVPVGPLGVPVVLQNMMVVLSALVLGGIQGGAAVGLFIAAGLLGLPVFAGGKGGVSVLLSPSGGYVVGYFVGSFAAGMFIGRPKIAEKKITAARAIRAFAAGAICMGLIYLLGAGNLMRNFGMTVPVAFMAGIVPYIPADAVKLVAAVALALRLRPIAARYIGDGNDA
jgi:biotin transport system substrate-specific component